MKHADGCRIGLPAVWNGAQPRGSGAVKGIS